MTTATLNAVLFTVGNGTGQDGQRTEYARVSVPARYVFRPPPPPPPPAPQNGISFVGSEPPPGAEFALTGSGANPFIFTLTDLRIELSVFYDTALPDAK